MWCELKKKNLYAETLIPSYILTLTTLKCNRILHKTDHVMKHSILLYNIRLIFYNVFQFIFIYHIWNVPLSLAYEFVYDKLDYNFNIFISSSLTEFRQTLHTYATYACSINLFFHEAFLLPFFLSYLKIHLFVNIFFSLIKTMSFEQCAMYHLIWRLL